MFLQKFKHERHFKSLKVGGASPQNIASVVLENSPPFWTPGHYLSACWGPVIQKLDPSSMLAHPRHTQDTLGSW